jgi:hypothetical protein
LILVLRDNSVMPLSRNMLTTNSLGPLTLRDTYVLNLPDVPVTPHWLWLLATIVGVIGGTMLIHHVALHAWSLLRSRSADRVSAIHLMSFSVWIMYAGLCILSGFFDRYLLYLIPFSAVIFWSLGLAAQKPSRFLRTATLAILAVFAVYDIAATHDYLAWNRARWDLLRHITEVHQISPNRIDGGYEFNGWYFYSKGYTSPPGKSWWYVKDDEYVVSFGPIPGYHLAEMESFTRLIPPGLDSVFVLCRDSPSVTYLPDSTLQTGFRSRSLWT